MKLIFLLSFLLLSYGAQSSSDAVLDSDGDEVKAGQVYYATSAFWGALGGGLELVPLNKSCPLYVARAAPLNEFGQPLAFFPTNPREDTIRVGRTAFIMFVTPTTCPQSTVWDYNPKQDYVTTGGTTLPSTGPRYSQFGFFKSETPLSDRLYYIAPMPLPNRQYRYLGLGLVDGKTLLRVKVDGGGWQVNLEKVTKKRATGLTIRSVAEGS